MIDERQVFERVMRGFAPPDGSLERLVHRRDRKRRNQRIAAGIVGIAVFAAAVWIVTTGGAFDRSTPAVPGSGPAETALPPAPASAGQTYVFAHGGGPCSDGARSHLRLRVDRRINVRFEVHRSPVGHEWRIELAHASRIDDESNVFFRGTRVASDSGDLVVHQHVSDPTIEQRSNGGYWAEVGVWVAKAVDTQTGQRCRVYMGP